MLSAANSEAHPEDGFNILVASDMHLTLSLDEVDQATDREIELFLKHYSTHRIDERPWLLVLAGDTFDFVFPAFELFVERYPEPSAPVVDSSHVVGHLDVSAIAWRLRKTIREHENLFLALGDFLAAANSVVFVKGNHDVELQWATVQDALLDELDELLRESGRQIDRDELDSRIHFQSWFYHLPGGVYVEHGCQYDELNAFPNFLDPALMHDPHRAFAPLGSRMVHYLTNAFTDFKPQPESGAFMRYIRETGQLLSKKFIWRSLRVIRYSLFTAGLFSEEGWKTTGGSADRFIDELSSKSKIPVDKLQSLRNLQSKPITSIRGFFYNRMFLDRLFVVCFGILACAIALLFGVFTWNEPALYAVLGATPVAVLGSVLLHRARGHLPTWYQWAATGVLCAGSLLLPLVLEQGTLVGTLFVALTALVVGISLIVMPVSEVIDLRAFLRQTALGIHETLGVPIVVFGHHHKIDVFETEGPDAMVYLNVGAWVGVGVSRGHSHAVLTRLPGGGLSAQLVKGREYVPSEGDADGP